MLEMRGGDAVVYINRNDKNCFYIVHDLTINEDVLSMTIEDTFYKFKFCLSCFKGVYGDGIIDCTELSKLEEIVNENYYKE